MWKLGAALVAASAGLTARVVSAMNVVITPTPDLAANPAALAAFNRAGQVWSSAFTDDITVNITGGFTTFSDPSVIGNTSSVKFQSPYDFFRGWLLASAAAEADDAVVAHVPDLAHFSATLPAGFTFSGKFITTKANFKALGFPDLDQTYGPNDATINFNPDIAFDYDSSNGIDANKIDFQAVAEHEIGHALGFLSQVDTVDAFKHNGTTTSLVIAPLDLFRFQDNLAGKDPASDADFTNFPRYLDTGGSAIFDDLSLERAMSTGTFTGDAREASHWKDDAYTGHLLGVMDPSMTFGIHESIGANDIRALDLIGYDAVPEPATPVVLLTSTFALARRRRQLP
jgi:hypothetical protein